MVEKKKAYDLLPRFLPREVIGCNEESNGVQIIFADDLKAAERRKANRERVKMAKPIKAMTDGNYEDS